MKKILPPCLNWPSFFKFEFDRHFKGISRHFWCEFGNLVFKRGIQFANLSRPRKESVKLANIIALKNGTKIASIRWV